MGGRVQELERGSIHSALSRLELEKSLLLIPDEKLKFRGWGDQWDYAASEMLRSFSKKGSSGWEGQSCGLANWFCWRFQKVEEFRGVQDKLFRAESVICSNKEKVRCWLVSQTSLSSLDDKNLLRSTWMRRGWKIYRGGGQSRWRKPTNLSRFKTKTKKKRKAKGETCAIFSRDMYSTG